VPRGFGRWRDRLPSRTCRSPSANVFDDACAGAVEQHRTGRASNSLSSKAICVVRPFSGDGHQHGTMESLTVPAPVPHHEQIPPAAALDGRYPRARDASRAGSAIVVSFWPKEDCVLSCKCIGERGARPDGQRPTRPRWQNRSSFQPRSASGSVSPFLSTTRRLSPPAHRVREVVIVPASGAEATEPEQPSR